MAIDPSIPLRATNQFDPNAIMQQALTLKDARIQSQRQDAEYQYQQGERQRAATLRDALAASYDPATGQIDAGKVRGAYLGQGDVAGAVKFDADQRAQQEAKLKSTFEHLGFVAQTVGAANDQASWDAGIQQAKARGLDVSQVPPQFSPQAKQTLLNQSLTAEQQLKQHAEEQGFDLKKLLAVNTIQHDRATEALTARGQNMTDARARAGQEMTAGSGLDANSIDYVAQQYAATGQLPALGMGKAATATRQAIIARAATMARDQGLTGADAAGIHADYKAGAKALGNITQQGSMVKSFEATANKNLDLALNTMGKGAGTTGIPILNAWQQAGRKNVAGNPDVSAFHTAVQTAATEYARVMTGGGNTPLSDSARHEVGTLLNTAQTPAQMAATIRQMKLDMANRRAGLDEETAALRTQLRGGSQKATAPPSGPVRGQTATNPTTRQKIVFDGQQWRPA